MSDFKVSENGTDFDVNAFADSFDAGFDGTVDDLDLPDSVKKEVNELTAKLEAEEAAEGEEEDPEIADFDDDPPWLERQEMEDFEQCDEYFGDHPI